MRKNRVTTVALLAMAILPIVCAAQDNQIYDFSISEQYLAQLADSGIQPVLQVHMDARTKRVHTLDADCEIHIATTPQGPALGSLPSVIVEPPNVCKFPPPGAQVTSETVLRNKTWPAFLDSHVMDKSCEVQGFPRIFTEHAQGNPDPANPNHVLEIHPALSINCEGEQLSFSSFLTYIAGMRAIKPSTAASCISQRQLNVRYAAEQYEFQEGGGQCGNFAIVEISSLNTAWIRKIKGGHSAIARVTADGASTATLKIYTLDGTKMDSWLADAMQNGIGNNRILLHGMLTYDYFSILKAVRTMDGQWTRPSEWEVVKFPLALVVFGQAQTPPWKEQ